MLGLVDFMNGAVGRIARAVIGLALIAWGLGSLGGTVGLVVAVIGLLPLAMGLWGRCLLELVVHRPPASCST